MYKHCKAAKKRGRIIKRAYGFVVARNIKAMGIYDPYSLLIWM